MERVHEADRRPWIGEKMKVREFKQQWADALGSREESEESPEEKDLRQKLVEFLGISEDDVKSLEEKCGPKLLDCGQAPDMEEIPDDVDLMTLKLQKQELDKCASNRTYQSLKTKGTACAASRPRFVDTASMDSDASDRVPVPVPEVGLVVQVFRPMKLPKKLRRMTISTTLRNKIQQELAVLGCQPLVALRRKIYCVADINAPGDYSEDPERPQGPKASHLYKSGFFFIGNTFYNDMTDPSCRDYSQVIREWAQDPKRNVGPFEAQRMEDTCFDDLEIQLGYPYVYVHQGYCEHLVVFSDMRMLNPDDSQNIADYPVILQNYALSKRLLCLLCHKVAATWVTYENARVTEDPFYFCNSCFHSYNYTPDKKKIGHFRAEQYFDVLV